MNGLVDRQALAKVGYFTELFEKTVNRRPVL